MSEKSNLVIHAERELDLLGMTADDPDEMNREMRKAIMDIVELFSKQGHSGMSAGYAIGTATKLLQYENLTAITDDPADWIEVGEGMWQCRRNPAFFSHNQGRTYYHVDDRNVVAESKPHQQSSEPAITEEQQAEQDIPETGPTGKKQKGSKS